MQPVFIFLSFFCSGLIVHGRELFKAQRMINRAKTKDSFWSDST